MQSANNQPKSRAFRPDPSKFRIFQIGFNKCGTRTLFNFFKRNQVPSIHYDGGRIAGSMFRHHRNNRHLIDIRYKNVVFFSDMENIYKESNPLYVSQHLFKKLDRQCPNSKYILNTRNREDWITSRKAHQGGDYLRYVAQKMNCSEVEVVDYWKMEWDTHHQNVLDYFKDRPLDLLVFNIDIHGPRRLANFFQPYLKLDTQFYGHQGKTPTQKLLEAEQAPLDPEKKTEIDTP